MSTQIKASLISIEQAQLMSLAAQGLLKINFGKGKKGTLNAIEHLGYIQIDTLAVVARAHHHTLWTRVSDYKEAYLNELLEKDKSIFEYWSHAASYLPMSDFRFSLPRKHEYASGASHWFKQDKKVNNYVLDRIKAEGPLQSKDFEFKRNGPSNWFEWKPAKMALEQLFMEGKLMIAKRQGFQKVYDLTERILPTTINTKFPTEKEQAEYLIKKAIQANGIVEEKEIVYLRSSSKEMVAKSLKQLVKNGELVETGIETKKGTYFTSQALINASTKLKGTEQIHIFSPFDNAVIQRKRVQQLFDFDYIIECYLPEPKRTYGYFCLPVMYNGQLVGRFDPKADRETKKTFYVKQIHFEKGFKPTAVFKKAFKEKLNSFAAFNGCEKLVGY